MNIKHIMSRAKNGIKRVLRSVDKFSKPDFYCNICQRDVRYAKDSPRHISPILSSGNIVGSGFRPRTKCPYCNSGDRMRFTIEVLRRYTDVFDKKCRVLEFAPMDGTRIALGANPKCEYVTADIVPGRGDVVQDITHMTFDDDSFDYVLCFHVLEHIEDEAAAIAEMKRVCVDHGKLVISMPIDISRATTLDTAPDMIAASESRLKHYAQEDHVRLYALDTADRLRGYGLKVTEVVANDEFSEQTKRLKLIKNDRNFVCEVVKG